MRNDVDRDGRRRATYGCDGGNDTGSLLHRMSPESAFSLGEGFGCHPPLGDLGRGLTRGCCTGTRDPDSEDAHGRKYEKSGNQMNWAKLLPGKPDSQCHGDQRIHKNVSRQHVGPNMLQQI